MQPHRYTRLDDLFEEFSTCFNEADTVIVTDVYEAGEQPIEGVNGQTLADAVSKHGHNDASYCADVNQLIDMLGPRLQPNDMVVFLGRGKCDQMGV